jgi:hypothetical protein
MDKQYVYWLRHINHIDLFNQGYIGVSNNPQERLRHHLIEAQAQRHSDKNLSCAIRKYGKENLCLQIILIADKYSCYDLEKKLRPTNFIGWNMREGGYHTPNPFPKGSSMPKNITLKAQETIASKRKMGHSVGRDRQVLVNDICYSNVKIAREANGISSSQMKRLLNGFEYKTAQKGNTKFNNLKVRYAPNA